MQPTTTSNENSLRITQEIRVQAPIEVTFDALLEELGPSHQVAEDLKIPMKLEARPGGRWYRDLGDDNGHLWGHVQAIKRPTLLEIWGPLFLSTAATSNVQYRLSEEPGGTLITFTHTLMGPFPEDHRPRLGAGWSALNARIRAAAERQ